MNSGRISPTRRIKKNTPTLRPHNAGNGCDLTQNICDLVSGRVDFVSASKSVHRKIIAKSSWISCTSVLYAMATSMWLLDSGKYLCLAFAKDVVRFLYRLSIFVVCIWMFIVMDIWFLHIQCNLWWKCSKKSFEISRISRFKKSWMSWNCAKKKYIDSYEHRKLPYRYNGIFHFHFKFLYLNNIRLFSNQIF